MNEQKVRESDGTHNGAPVYCTVNGWDCPYYDNGICYTHDPVEDCDDFSSFFESWDEWENS